jgi:hypothetical protein
MTLEFTEVERTKLATIGLRQALDPPAQTSGVPFDAIWIGRKDTGEAIIRALLRVIRFSELPGEVFAWVTACPGKTPIIRRIPSREMVWLLGAPYPLARDARVPNLDPLMSLPGESDAYRLRRVAGIDQVSTLPPTEIVRCLDGFRLATRRVNRDQGMMRCGFRRLKTGVKLVVDSRENGAVCEDSAGFSLMMWFLSTESHVTKALDWKEIPILEASRPTGFLNVFNAYQALRLPALRLFLELRATPHSFDLFSKSLADANKLPPNLVRRRLNQILELEANLGLF